MDAEEESQEVVDGFFQDAVRGFDNDGFLKRKAVYEGRKKNLEVSVGEGGAARAEGGSSSLCAVNNW